MTLETKALRNLVNDLWQAFNEAEEYIKNMRDSSGEGALIRNINRLQKRAEKALK